MSFYSNLASTATRLILKRGQSVVYTRDDNKALNPASGKYSEGVETTVSVKGLEIKNSSKELRGSLIDSGDVIIISDPTGEPKIDDNCLINGVNYRVIMVDPLNPGGTILLYTVQLRL